MIMKGDKDGYELLINDAKETVLLEEKGNKAKEKGQSDKKG